MERELRDGDCITCARSHHRCSPAPATTLPPPVLQVHQTVGHELTPTSNPNPYPLTLAPDQVHQAVGQERQRDRVPAPGLPRCRLSKPSWLRLRPTSWCSGGLLQRQITPISRLGRAGRPHRGCHVGRAFDTGAAPNAANRRSKRSRASVAPGDAQAGGDEGGDATGPAW
eukprot:scaffold123905_cov51-Phaeocystis_antarctica.AAC.1